MCSSAVGRWWRPFRAVAGAAVFHVDLAPHAAHEAEAFAWLSPDEQARSRRFLHAGPRRRFALSRAALRAVLCQRLACNSKRLTFGTSSYGKPFAEVDRMPHPISFNVTHSRGHGLIAVAPAGRLGVDIEERVSRGDLDDLTAAMLGPNEKREFALLRGESKNPCLLPPMDREGGPDQGSRRRVFAGPGRVRSAIGSAPGRDNGHLSVSQPAAGRMAHR